MGQAPYDVHTDAVPDSSARWSEKGEKQMNAKRSLTKTLALPALVTTFAMVLLLMTGLPASAAPAPWNISSGDLVISSGGDYAVTGSTTSHTIAVNTADAVTITLNNVFIDVSATSDRRALDSGGNVTLLLSGTNTLKSGANAPGIRVTAGEQLTVNNAASSAGSLFAYGGSAGAGIGGGNTEGGGAVTVVGGAVTATGGVTGAGIGGGSGGAGGSVSISGGSVTARSQGWGAGIGGGYLKNGGAVTISGGAVTVAAVTTPPASAARTPAMQEALVTITGGTVTVNGGIFGAGIGGGYGGDGGDVVIRGGSIRAYGGSAGSNIGAGNLGASAGTLTNGFGPVALRTIAGAVAPVDPTPVSFLIPVTGPGYAYDYVYTGAGHGGGDTNLYFYLPPGTLPALSGPSGLTATAVSSTQIGLTWVDNDTAEQGFKIERSVGAGSTVFTQIATVGANVTSFSNAGLTASTSYSYRVRAYNADGDSGYSNTAGATTPAAAATPNAPSKLTATAASKSQINLAWADNAGNETGFIIERAKGSTGTDFTRIATVGANVTRYSSTGLTATTTYRYRVYAYNASGTSGYSNIASAKTLRR